MNRLSLMLPGLMSPWRSIMSYYDEPFGGMEHDSDRYCPPVDVYESEKSYRLRVELPGFTDKDFHLETSDGRLILTGERPEGNHDKEKVVCRESMAGKFTRSFHLPEDVDVEGIKAKFEHGILEITLPLRAKKARTIEVKLN